MLLLSGMTENELEAHKDKLCRGSAGSGPSLETSDVTLVWDDGNELKVTKLCRGSAGSGPSLETSDVTLVWDVGKRVKVHKDKLCRGSDENYKVNASCEKE